MKQFIAGTAVILLLAVALWYILFVPPLHQIRYGVSFVQKGYQTNAAGLATPVFAVSNSGPREVFVTAGRQIAPNAFDMLGSLPQRLAPGQATLVMVPLSAQSTQARAFLHCQAADPPSKVGRLVGRFLLKQRFVELVYAEGGAK